MNKLKEGKQCNQLVIDEKSLENVPPSHRAHAYQRVEELSKITARIKNLRYGGFGEPEEGEYGVFSGPLSRKKAKKLGIEKPSDLHGAVVSHREHARSKAIYYPITGRHTPEFHSRELAKRLRKKGVVMEGTVAFRKKDLKKFIKKHKDEVYAYRLKVPDASDGEGQVGNIRAPHDIGDALKKVEMKKKDIRKRGVALEPNLETITGTFSVGQVELGGKYSFIAEQRDEKVRVIVDGKEIEQTRFMGADNVRVVRGGLKQLEKLLELSPVERKAVKNARRFKKAFKRTCKPIMSRWSIDNVHGQKGNEDVVIMTDHSMARPTGIDPAAWLAVEQLANNPDHSVKAAKVELIYGEDMDKQPVQEGQVIFVNQPDLRIVAQLIEPEVRTDPSDRELVLASI